MSLDHCSQPEFYHSHVFHEHERRTRMVVGLTAVMMLAEIIGGHWFGSMALLADGFHMGTHVGALGISVLAYMYARRHVHDPRYSFGTGKVSELAGFTSAILLGFVALYIVYESLLRLIHPITIAYGEAIAIATVGLAVNVVSALILHGAHQHSHAHENLVEEHGHEAHHHEAHEHDNNFRSAYMHVIADAITSILALIALFCGRYFGWIWMDPLMGIVGSIVIISWAWSLVRDTSAVLLDRAPEAGISEKIRSLLAEQGATVTDLHVWRLGPGAHAAIIALRAQKQMTSDHVRMWLKVHKLAHVTVEINLD